MASAAGVGDIITELARVLECNQQALGVDDRYPRKLKVLRIATYLLQMLIATETTCLRSYPKKNK